MAIARPLARAGVRADTVSYLSLFFAYLAFISLLVFQSPILFGCSVFIAGLLDGVDGAVARETSSGSSRGAFTDSVLDKAAEIIILFAILLVFSGSVVLGLSVESWIFLAVSGWLMTSYTRARAESLGARNLDIGLGGRSERLLILVVFSLLGLVLWGIVVVSLVSLGTAVYRAIHYSGQIRDSLQ
jgi:phosphatidylglycerophosphate synthase